MLLNLKTNCNVIEYSSIYLLTLTRNLLNVLALNLFFKFAHILPLLLPPLVAGSHMLTLWVWCILFQFESATHHSGYHFPFLSSPEFHDYHHLK